jgi:hypothetical protein
MNRKERTWKKNLIEEKSEKSQFLERLNICLRIIAIVSLIIGVYLLLMNPSSNSISPGMQTIIDNMDLIEYGMAGFISLICLIVAFIARKDSPKLALVILIAGIAVPLIVWYLHISFPQPHLVPSPN